MIEFAISNVWLIGIMPILAGCVALMVVKPWPKLAHTVLIVTSAIAWYLATLILVGAWQGYDLSSSQWNYRLLTTGDFELNFGIAVDNLTALMLFIVMTVSTLVQLFSTKYVEGDPGYSRFFAFLGLFTSSMLGLILVDNLLGLFIFWELVGVSSYLLIGHWYQKPSAAEAAKKAFITNRVGDFGFLIGIMIIFAYTGTLEFSGLREAIVAGDLSGWILTAAGIGIFCGAIGKSAQWPLHVWLPDAMEGPTPVSALIHAATMVAAGVYMVGKIYFLFEASLTTLQFIAWIGVITAFLAACIAIVQYDIKKALAYSTVSQLGFMMFALGMGPIGYAAALFHLMTHAFFKGMMFLDSGSVIHGCHHEQDMRRMGGLHKLMPFTSIIMLIGCLAIAGIFPFSGFFSKDEVLAAAAATNPMVYVLGAITAGLTSFYMFRMYFMTFSGTYRGDAHPHESPWQMTVPLGILAFFTITAGWLALPHFWGGPNYIADFLTYTPVTDASTYLSLNWTVMILATLISVSGITMAYLMYVKGTICPDKMKERFSYLHRLLTYKFFYDEVYNAMCKHVVVGAAKASWWFDRTVIDGIVNALGDGTYAGGEAMRRLQWGSIQTYLSVLVLAVAIIAALLFIR
ncbi:NADH-quinone oxidoreductase subunit L [Desulfurispira natronophila]|uniref:NADH-quinone oxidoreductase subunit L n=1 Tax=Desulfurispira natronophila TaxID=682562 RepID=A0A7W8DHJ9_9BACT|nr:NADH-quinone oxidoreductase subunit L [Desulfurispira natronophila]MBB5022457.1 NADH-quinone oxidoreductase subunit L [Desulfurispira natronophila]